MMFEMRYSVKTNHLLCLFSSIIIVLGELYKDKALSESVISEYREYVASKIAAIDKSALEYGITIEALEHAKYIIVAFIDESILKLMNAASITYQYQPLQLDYFLENIAGEGVYQRLAKLRQHPNKYIDVLEVYYYCLQLGFAGKYSIQEQDILTTLLSELRDQIQVARRFSTPEECIESYKKKSLVENIYKYLSVKVILAIIAIALLFIFGCFSLSTSHSAEIVVTDVNQINQSIIHNNII